MADRENDVYGDGMGKIGNGVEQTDIANRPPNYPGRFGPPQPDLKPAERQIEIDVVKG